MAMYSHVATGRRLQPSATGGTGAGFGGNGSGGGAGVGGRGSGGKGCSGIVLLVTKSLLLKRLAVDLIHTHKAADKVPIFLIRKTTGVRRPSKLAGGLWMIRIVDQIAFDSGIRRKRLSLINQDGVVDAETRIGG